MDDETAARAMESHGAGIAPVVTPDIERRNSLIFMLSWLLTYFAAPVLYVGVVQAALCDKLGASATIANLPASAFLFGSFAPILLAWKIPLRLEQSVIVWANTVTAASLALVSVALALSLPASVQIPIVIGQSFIYGLFGSVSSIYMYQCLGRGTTSEGRTRTLKMTFALGPVAAVAGSLTSQVVLNRGIPGIDYPYDFALLYFIGVPCTAAIAWVNRGYRLPPAVEEARRPLAGYMTESLRSYFGSRPLALLWYGYVLWFCTLNAMPNLSLYAREAIGRDPKELSGIINMLRFGFKSGAGWLLGVLANRRGDRAPVALGLLLLGLAVVWTWGVKGYPYLLAFGLMGAGELGSAYFLIYGLALSSPETGARNLAILTLATPVSSIAPALHGWLTDLYGFPASFAFACLTTILGMWCVLKLPAGKASRG